MIVEVLGSGSSGNCILLDEEVMIDAGVPFKRIGGDAKNIHTVLMTHIHGDHFNPATIRKMVVNSDAVFLCNRSVRDALFEMGVARDRVKTANVGSIIERYGWNFSPVLLYHDAPNIGWRVVNPDDEKHFHATDTVTLEGITAKNYDTATIECNHHLPTALKLIEEAEANGEFTHLRGAINSHLSVDKAIKFIKKNGIKHFTPCHIGDSTRTEVMQALAEAFPPERREHNDN